MWKLFYSKSGKYCFIHLIPGSEFSHNIYSVFINSFSLICVKDINLFPKKNNNKEYVSLESLSGRKWP